MNMESENNEESAGISIWKSVRKGVTPLIEEAKASSTMAKWAAFFALLSTILTTINIILFYSSNRSNEEWMQNQKEYQLNNLELQRKTLFELEKSNKIVKDKQKSLKKN